MIEVVIVVGIDSDSDFDSDYDYNIIEIEFVSRLVGSLHLGSAEELGYY